MLFMYVHTHSVEKCVHDKPEEAKKMLAHMQEAYKKAGIKMLATYMAPHEHTLFMVLEANDYSALDKANEPLTVWGTARLIPVTTLEQLVPK